MAERSGVDYALELAGWGFVIVPAPLKAKLPIIKWKQFQSHTPDEGQLRTWFRGRRMNYFAVMGELSRMVTVDCDSAGGEAYWRDRLGSDVMDATCTSQTRKGMQFIFRVPGGVAVPRNQSFHEGEVQWDIRGQGGGIIVPPSVHESGHIYTWVRDPSYLQLAPEALLVAEKATTGPGRGEATSMLSKLLESPPGEGGRNDWMARVAGHLAKRFRDTRDLYDVQCRMANDLCRPPLDNDELNKIANSIWDSEHAKSTSSLVRPDDTNGWLVSGGYELLTQIKKGKGDESEFGLQSWGDFDIEARAVVEDDGAQRIYDVVVKRLRQQDERRGLLSAKDLVGPNRLAEWLAEMGVGFSQPTGTYPWMAPQEKLRRYLESQDPKHFRVVNELGWDGNGFITHEGVITPSGLRAHDTVKPHDRLRGWAPYRYGFRAEEEAIEVLREVLSFHDETVCSVYGAWWAACLLKPQIQARASLFPFMALQAPSESGKTTGFFAMMLTLNGNTQGQTKSTYASFRDYVSCHHSGIVWLDDLDDPQSIHEVVRQATGEGSVSKKGEDRHSQETVRLLAPICISGETLGFRGQKALLDRAVKISVPSPTQRRSLHDLDRPQWDDILALRTRYPDLTEFAGTLVQMALRRVGMVDGLRQYAPEAGGRWGDKIAVVRLGARILADMVGDPSHIDRVDDWARSEDHSGSENRLTLEIIPTVLRHTEWKSEPDAPFGQWPATPALSRRGRQGEEQVWFSPDLLAAWWKAYQGGRTEARVDDAEQLRDQARALGLGGRKGTDRRTFNGHNYWRCGRGLSDALMRRSRGEDGDGGGVHPSLEATPLWVANLPTES